jgi:site-specific recombinase XerD
MQFNEDINKIEDFLDNGHYEEAIERSFKIVEKCLEDLYEKIFTKLSVDIQLKILEDIKKNHQGKRFNDLMIGEKLKIFDSYKLISFLNINLNKEVNPKKLLELNTLRVDSSHQKRKITKGEAYYSYSICLRFIEKIGYNSIVSKKAPKKFIKILKNQKNKKSLF